MSDVAYCGELLHTHIRTTERQLWSDPAIRNVVSVRALWGPKLPFVMLTVEAQKSPEA